MCSHIPITRINFRIFSLPPKEIPLLIAITSPNPSPWHLPHPQALQPLMYFFVSINLPSLGILCKQNHTVSTLHMCVPSTSDMSDTAACPPSPIADDPSALPSPTSSPSSIRNSSGLFTPCQLYATLYASCCAVPMYFSRYRTLRFKMFSLLLLLLFFFFYFIFFLILFYF